MGVPFRFERWQRNGPVDVVVTNAQASRRCECDEPRGHFGQQGLSPFVVADISLGTADTFGEYLLCNAQTFTDGFEVVHAAHSSSASSFGQYRR